MLLISRRRTGQSGIGFLVGVIILASIEATAADWPQFRGPNATGVSTETKALPVEFSSTEKVLWSAELGTGISGPVVAGGRAFATSMVGEQTFAVFGFDATNGKQLWRKEFETGPLLEITSPNEHASSTPATDGERVYVHFGTLGLMGLDAANGNLLWKHPTPKPFYLLGWGPANSPIIYENMVIFNLDDDLAPFLLAVDKYTGEQIWQTERPQMLAGYSVPVVCRAGGQEDIVVAGSGKLIGYNPATGDQRWVCNSLLRTVMTTPAVDGDRIFISVQSYGDADRVLKFALLQWKDTNQDGKLDKTEVGEAFATKFDHGDRDRDGFLVDDEIDLAFQSTDNLVGGGTTIQSIQGGGTGDVTKTHQLWNLSNKSPSNIVSPLVVDGQVFVVKKGGISASFDSKTGETTWAKRRIRNLGNYYASPIAGDGKIYVMGENGYVVVLEQGPQLRVLAKNDMGESSLATPAIADGRIYVRTVTKLYCISHETAD